MDEILASPQKGAIALPHKHQCMIISGTGHHYIQGLIQIKIFYRDVSGFLAGSHDFLILKTSITIAQKKRQGIALNIAGDEISKPITIEIANTNCGRAFSYRKILIMVDKIRGLIVISG